MCRLGVCVTTHTQGITGHQQKCMALCYVVFGSAIAISTFHSYPDQYPSLLSSTITLATIFQPWTSD